jgi:hypothetical protein
MKLKQLLIGACSSIPLVAANHCSAVTFSATATLVSPTNNQVLHTGGATSMSVSATGSNMTGAIDGASANQSFNVQWTMELEIDSSPLSGTMDSHNGIVTCNSMGHYDHADTASLSGSATCSAQSQHTAIAYVDFYDVNNLMNKANQHPTAMFRVQNP